MNNKDNISYQFGKKIGKYTRNKILKKTINKTKETITSGAGITGIATGTAAAMTTTSLGLKGAFLGSFVALNASTVAVPLAAAGGYIAYNALKSRKYRKENKDLLNKLDQKQRELLDSEELIVRLKKSKNKTVEISGSHQHRKIFIETIKNAKEQVVVYSGWVTEYSMDDEFKNHLKSAMKRGVNFYLGFGYVDSRKRDLISENYMKNAISSLMKLRQWSAEINTKGKLYVIKFPNHKKILTCDYKYIIYGSYNWLSNKYSKNDELSLQYFEKDYVESKVDYFIQQFDSSYNRREFLNKFTNFTEHP